ncbi:MULTISPECIES: tryptophan transporter [Tepidanaerobacter]|uniref:Tryptophan transporter TrpP n=1 Tax=Tepidanaerobacter syntrophicus TaxID=224999 RepID=A0A0U9HKA7_9FIRM|nr:MULTISPECIES: tryptophan transporter [Tepidanaerobacter]GAQ24739.1 tryptophan transporter TrpP [Tepidanaerobacter syntrophicus]GLI18991.1 tryptophan transporter [Tepidanaerobacter syntrophicus]GLI51135.1 tryptophan transporter [Tepidanaerobacter syntrophicus]HHV83858.1 tryptophan transporter [Tepidanaerobacter syntrophicus]
MKLRDMILTSLLIAIGLVLHYIVPPIMGGMKPDFLLSMLFVALYIDSSPKNAVLAGILAGIFSALTTGFPGGQIANMCDKIVTAFAVIAMIKAFSHLNQNAAVIITAIIGTIISGTVFLGTALFVVGSLPLAFPVLFTTVVLPAAAVNTIATFICYKVVASMQKSALHKA